MTCLRGAVQRACLGCSAGVSQPCVPKCPWALGQNLVSKSCEQQARLAGRAHAEIAGGALSRPPGRLLLVASTCLGTSQVLLPTCSAFAGAKQRNIQAQSVRRGSSCCCHTSCPLPTGLQKFWLLAEGHGAGLRLVSVQGMPCSVNIPLKHQQSPHRCVVPHAELSLLRRTSSCIHV